MKKLTELLETARNCAELKGVGEEGDGPKNMVIKIISFASVFNFTSRKTINITGPTLSQLEKVVQSTYSNTLKRDTYTK